MGVGDLIHWDNGNMDLRTYNSELLLFSQMAGESTDKNHAAETSGVKDKDRERKRSRSRERERKGSPSKDRKPRQRSRERNRSKSAERFEWRVVIGSGWMRTTCQNSVNLSDAFCTASLQIEMHRCHNQGSVESRGGRYCCTFNIPIL